MELKKITRALISVSDKTNLADMLQILKEFDVEIVSTGGTYKAIKDLGYRNIKLYRFS